MNAKELIEKIKKDYDTSLTEIAKTLFIDRNVFYRVMRADKPFSNLMNEKLKEFYPKSFIEPVPFVGDGTEENTEAFEEDWSDVEEALSAEQGGVIEKSENCMEALHKGDAIIPKEQAESRLHRGSVEPGDIHYLDSSDIDQAIETDARFQLDEEPRKKLKRPNPPMWNVHCPEKCYFVKVLVKDYNLLKPRCPMCQSEMLNKEDMRKHKAGIDL